VVETRELEIEQLDVVIGEHHHVAVIGVVVTEGEGTRRKTPLHFHCGLIGDNDPEVVAHCLFLWWKEMPLLFEDEPSKTTPLRVEKFKEGLLGKICWLKLMKSEQFRRNPLENDRILEVTGRESATVVELLDPALFVVMEASRSEVLLTEQQKDLSL
jgi:hypothetical protein